MEQGRNEVYFLYLFEKFRKVPFARNMPCYQGKICANRFLVKEKWQLVL